MKRKIRLLTVMVMLLSALMAVKALAVDVLYADTDSMKIYQEKSRDSAVLKTVPGGTQLLVEEEGGAWWGVLIEDPAGDGQTIGYVNESDMALVLPSRYCNHSWTEWTTHSQPTCTENGMMLRDCPVCGVGEMKEIPKLGHDFGAWSVTRQASCTQEGQRVRTCSRCGKQETETIPKEAHRFNEWTVTKQPTCTAEGERVHTCIICGTQEKETLSRLPHTYGEWTVLKEPACTAEGERIHTCAVCGYNEKEAIAMLPHNYEWEIILETTDHSAGIRAQKCKDCGHTEAEESFDPEGTLRRGDRSEEVTVMQQLLADQNYLNADGADGIFGGGTEKALMEFQTDQNLTADGVCWPQTFKRLQHEFGEWTVEKKLTRESAGERVRVCRDCGFEQHEAIEPEPSIAYGDRAEDVRAVQQILTQLGYDPGAPDGIYGQKMDAAYGKFAEDHQIDFETGRLFPAHIDALINEWTGSIPDEEWKGEGKTGDPVNLALTVEPAMEGIEGEEEDLHTYNWSLTNLGDEPCLFNALLLQYGEDPDFHAGSLIMVLDGQELKEHCANSASGSFVVSRDWGEGPMSFTALTVSEAAGAKWTSNTVLIKAAEEETEEVTEAATEAAEETEAVTEAA